MSKSKMTPGPWHADPAKYGNAVVTANALGGTGVVALLNASDHREDTMLDARAIAAVPDLIEALQSIAEQTHIAGDEAQAIAREALRKAGAL